MATEEKLRQITEVLDQLAEDTSVPRNIRRGAKDAKERLMNTKNETDVRVNSAVTLLDELANDPNIPLHGRTLIWNIISQLETIRGDDSPPAGDTKIEAPRKGGKQKP